jgi:tetratricopeptide (TPR) repeat protein
MNIKVFRTVFCLALIVFLLGVGIGVVGQIPNQLAQDFVAGDPPPPEDVAKFERDVAANPTDLRLTRKLGKAYFFQFFGDGDTAALPKSQKTLEHALTLTKDDPETLAYLGSLHILRAVRLEKGNAAKQKASFDKGFEFVKLAEKLDPRNGAVTSVASGSYLWLPDSYAMAPHVVGMLEGMIKGMGPYFKKFAHHGQQRILLTLGQAYVRTGQPEKAKAAFDEALAVNGTSREAGLLRAELAKMAK